MWSQKLYSFGNEKYAAPDIPRNHPMSTMKCLNIVVKESFTITEMAKIQHYKPSDGYYSWHMENNGKGTNRNRHLVFMTYLNNVEDGGGTDFKYQKITTPAKKGLTLIWPAYWTHTHRGVISDIDEKHIITGWFNFYDQ